MWQIIDGSGAVRLELPGVGEVTLGYGHIEAGGTYYSTSTFEPAVFYGYTGIPTDGGYWVKGETGVRVFLSDGSQVYFSGAESLLGRSGELWLVELADGEQAVMDKYSRVVIYGECSFRKRRGHGRDVYIQSRHPDALRRRRRLRRLRLCGPRHRRLRLVRRLRQPGLEGLRGRVDFPDSGDSRGLIPARNARGRFSAKGPPCRFDKQKDRSDDRSFIAFVRSARGVRGRFRPDRAPRRPSSRGRFRRRRASCGRRAG